MYIQIVYIFLKEIFPRLIFIKKCENVGKIRIKTRDHTIYRIKEILLLSLSPPGSLFDDNDSLASVECDLEAIRINNLNFPLSKSAATEQTERSNQITVEQIQTSSGIEFSNKNKN